MPSFGSREEDDPASATDSELESAALLSHPAAQAPAASGWSRAGVAKAALLLGVGCAVGLVAYGATPAGEAPDPVQDVPALGFDTGGIVQESSSANHTCPGGYFPIDWDMMNHDADLLQEVSLSADRCAERCGGDAKCKGFEYNEAAGQCWVTRSGHHCTERQHDGWVSCLKSTAACPAGYAPTELDMQNHDADMHEESLTAAQCAGKCSGDPQCKGFEFNEAAGHCWVTRSGHHCTEKQHEGWVSCMRMK